MKQHIRVSEILGRLRNYGDIDEQVLKAKCDIGTDVHQAIILDAIGDFPMMKTERATAYFQSYCLLAKKERFEFKMQVPRLYCNELMITGEIDALISTNMKPMLMDWKCSATIDKEIWEMQAHFYWYLLHRNNIEVSNVMRWVQLRHQKVKLFADNDLGEYTIQYRPLAPKVVEFVFDENVLSRCIDEAHKAWEEKRNSLVLDF